jgi:hypothetical protein
MFKFRNHPKDIEAFWMHLAFTANFYLRASALLLCLFSAQLSADEFETKWSMESGNLLCESDSFYFIAKGSSRRARVISKSLIQNYRLDSQREICSCTDYLDTLGQMLMRLHTGIGILEDSISQKEAEIKSVKESFSPLDCRESRYLAKALAQDQGYGEGYLAGMLFGGLLGPFGLIPTLAISQRRVNRAFIRDQLVDQDCYERAYMGTYSKNYRIGSLGGVIVPTITYSAIAAVIYFLANP